MRLRQHLFLIRLALLNTFKKKFRAALVLGGIMLSSCIMIVLFGTGIGLKGLVTEQVTNSGFRDVLTVNQRSIQAIQLDTARVSTIRSISGVGQVEELIGFAGTLTYHGINLSIPVYAVSADFFSMSQQEVPIGSLAKQPVGDKIILSTKAMETFGIKTDAAGKKVAVTIDIPQGTAADKELPAKTTQSTDFTVAAVIDRGDAPIAYVPIEYARQQGVSSVSQLKVRLTDPGKLTAVRETIEQMGLQTVSIQDSIDQVDRIFSVLQRVIVIFAIVALAITVFGTFTVITLTLAEETRQIGFLRLMGMQKREVAFLFITQSVVLTVGGICLGVVAGSFAGFAINGLTQALVGNTIFSGSVYLFKIPYLQIIIMVMLSVVLGWFIGSIPAKRAVVIGPLEELHE